MWVELVVLTGLQGSGKSTFYRSRFAATHAHISKDLFPNARDRRRRQRELVQAAAREGRSVVVDNTNATRADREELVTLARSLGMRPVCFFFPPDVKASLARNARREGKARVPQVAVFATARRLEPPGDGEGFEAIHDVRALEDGTFEVVERRAVTRP
jgi:predicted kinase